MALFYQFTLKLIIKNRTGGRGLDCAPSGQREVASCCEHGNEPLDYIKWGEFLD